MPTLTHPYTNLTGGLWLRGNLHAHTTRSDGRRSPQEVIDVYAALGHHFLMFSDHDCLATPEYYATLDAKNLLLIPGYEVTAQGPHLLHVNADRFLTPHPQRQQVINDCLASTGFIIANHPNWFASFDHTTLAQLREWTGYVGLEIYNGTIGRLDGSPYATNKWDMLLAAGRRLWGFAHDDSHLATGDTGLGWNVAYVPSPANVASVVEALAAGRFYGSTGVVIKKFEVNGMHIRLETENADRIVALKNTAKRFAQVDATTIEVDVPEDATYVRFECWGRGEQFAWTQPFYVEKD